MPADPPITDGLLFWVTAEIGVRLNGLRNVAGWSDARGGWEAEQWLPAAQPLLVPNGLGSRPVIRFDGTQSLYLPWIGMMSGMDFNSFESTILLLARPT